MLTHSAHPDKPKLNLTSQHISAPKGKEYILKINRGKEHYTGDNGW